MSYKATAWAYDLPIFGSRKFVLVALADMADEAGSCYPGQERLMAMTGLSERTVRRSLERLEAEGLLVREARHDSRGYRTSDRYYLQLTVVALPASVSVAATEMAAPPVENAPTGQPDRRSDGPHLPAILAAPTGHSDRAKNHQENHQENHQGGAPLSPTCGKHPNGTTTKCRACGDARRLWEDARKAALEPKPAESRYDLVTVYCEHLQLRTDVCEACVQEARKALEQQFGGAA